MNHFTDRLADVDPDIHAALEAEVARQRDGAELIASENLVSSAVREARGRGAQFTRRDLRIYSPLTLTMGVFTVVAVAGGA